jgi:hypothetical protein
MSIWLVSRERTQSCHVGEPYDMVPRMTLEIRRPLEPRFWYSILDSCVSVGTEPQRITSRLEIELKRLELGDLSSSERNELFFFFVSVFYLYRLFIMGRLYRSRVS